MVKPRSVDGDKSTESVDKEIDETAKQDKDHVDDENCDCGHDHEEEERQR